MVLILVLWALALLTVLTTYIGIQVRQKITMLSRLSQRSELRHIARAGVQKGKAVLFRKPRPEEPPQTPAQIKAFRHNNSVQFQDIVVGKGVYEVSYRNYDFGLQNSVKHYGVVDEERKININTADRDILQKLFQEVLAFSEDAAKDLAAAIYDWRVYGDSEIVGFFSDEYYDNLEFPYEEKKGNFETLDEILFVHGVTDDVYQKLTDFITIYGSGQVNINTASEPVLSALGLSSSTVRFLLSFRRGKDDKEGTEDDVIFTGTDLSQFVSMSDEERNRVQELNGKGLLGTHSQFFRVQSIGRNTVSGEVMKISCVYDESNGKIVYWRE